ncbi:hypothetical protein F5876DRAFT_67700 [Lentinula aff. lateritia]|uniref:Uncharacterized protein n=1 Tax=Lentinula aff. lateritia TaxID=2804960 RepID=A0ACC1TT96_9AGAR|nr:hypothetical protein F5876DRAFT_67700 [Lentinula aff. lateritia]
MVQVRTVINALITFRAASVLAVPVPEGVFNALVSQTREDSLSSLVSLDQQEDKSAKVSDSSSGSLDFDWVQHTKRASPSPPGSPPSDGSDSNPSSPPTSLSVSHWPLTEIDHIPPDLQEKFRYLASRLDSDEEREIYDNAVRFVSGLQDPNTVVRQMTDVPKFLLEINDLSPPDQLRMLFLRVIDFKQKPYNPRELTIWNDLIMKPLKTDTPCTVISRIIFALQQMHMQLPKVQDRQDLPEPHLVAVVLLVNKVLSMVERLGYQGEHANRRQLGRVYGNDLD